MRETGPCVCLCVCRNRMETLSRLHPPIYTHTHSLRLKIERETAGMAHGALKCTLISSMTPPSPFIESTPGRFLYNASSCFFFFFFFLCLIDNLHVISDAAALLQKNPGEGETTQIVGDDALASFCITFLFIAFLF